MRGAPPPPVIRPPNAAADHQFVGAQLYRLGLLAAWHLPGGPVVPPVKWVNTSNVEGGSGTEDGTQGPLAKKGGFYLDELFAEAPDFLVTPLLMGPVCLISQDRYEELVRP